MATLTEYRLSRIGRIASTSFDPELGDDENSLEITERLPEVDHEPEEHMNPIDQAAQRLVSRA